MRKFLFILLIFICVSFGNEFKNHEINIYFNDVYSDYVTVIEDHYFSDNVSLNDREKYLNITYLKSNFPLFVKDIKDISVNLVNNYNTLEIKYKGSIFDIYKKQGRFITKIAYCYSFRPCYDDTLYISNNTTLNLYFLLSQFDHYNFSKTLLNFKNKSNDGVYVIFSIKGPKTIKNFYILKTYKENIIPFNFPVNNLILISFLIFMFIVLFYFKDIFNIFTSVFNNGNGKG